MLRRAVVTVESYNRIVAAKIFLTVKFLVTFISYLTETSVL